MKWIPTSERLPSEQGEYLVTIPLDNNSTYVDVLHFHKGKFYDTDSEWGDIEYDDVLAWMPLPEPYKADRKSEPQTEDKLHDYCKKRNCVWWSRSSTMCLAERNGLACKYKSGKE